MKNFLKRFIARNIDYSTRHHLMARFHSLDFRFLGAVVVLVAAVILVLQYA
jgi:hypothetical protein